MTDSAVKDATAGGAKDTKDKRFLILGCGPAGLIAARTLEQNGVDTDHFKIVSKDAEPSVISGAQFLHRPIIDQSDHPDAKVAILRMGSAEGYARKVYGDPGIPTSFSAGASEVDAWSLIKTYDQLWSDYEPGIEPRHIDDEAFTELIQSGEFDEVISTIPPTAYCSNPSHVFESVPIILGEPMDAMPMDNCVVYSGRDEDGWYRCSSLFGEDSIEFGTNGDSAITNEHRDRVVSCVWESRSEMKTGLKPLKTTCDCGYGHADTKLLRVGRFGMWDRKVLLHQVPAQVAAIL